AAPTSAVPVRGAPVLQRLPRTRPPPAGGSRPRPGLAVVRVPSTELGEPGATAYSVLSRPPLALETAPRYLPPPRFFSRSPAITTTSFDGSTYFLNAAFTWSGVTAWIFFSRSA